MPRRRRPVSWESLARLQGERLTLRPPQLSDAREVYAYANDTEVTSYLAWPRHVCLDDSEDFLRRAVEDWKSGRRMVWLIQDNDGVAGAIGIDLRGVNAGLGYVLTRDRWGKGYATEALGLLTETLFQQTPVETIWAMCVPENAASQRVLEKVGYRCQRRYNNYFVCPNLDGVRKDVFLYARAKKPL